MELSGPAKALVTGYINDVKECVAAIAKMNLTACAKISTEKFRAGSVIGKGAEHLKKLEEEYGIFIELGQQEIAMYGEPKKVQAAEKDVRARLEDASSEEKISTEADKAKTLIGDGGRTIRSMESETGTQIKVGKGEEKVEVVIKGGKDAVAAATKKVKDFS